MSEPITETLMAIRCAACTMPFSITEALMQRRQRDHMTFYCPIGHENVWKQTDEQKTNEQLRATIQTLQEEIISLRNVRKDVAEMEPKDWRQKLGLRS